MVEVRELPKTQEIVSTLKPFESAWCDELQADIIMFYNGYSVHLYDVDKDVYIAAYFVPIGK